VTPADKAQTAFFTWAAKRIAYDDALIAAFAEDAALAKRFRNATVAQGLALLHSLEGLDRAGPLVREQLCALIDRGGDPAACAVLDELRLEDPTDGLYARAVARIDSSNPGVARAAIAAVGIRTDEMAPAVLDQIAARATDSDAQVRLGVAYAAGRRRASVALAMLDDPDAEIRYAATYSLAHFREHVELAEARAEMLVRDRKVQDSMRMLAAEMFRDVARTRALYALLAGQGVREAIDVLTRGGPIFTGAPLLVFGPN
jgi:hypothetical protein